MTGEGLREGGNGTLVLKLWGQHFSLGRCKSSGGGGAGEGDSNVNVLEHHGLDT